MDTEYLKKTVGSCLINCLVEVNQVKPEDPIEYIAQWLYNDVENDRYEIKVT